MERVFEVGWLEGGLVQLNQPPAEKGIILQETRYTPVFRVPCTQKSPGWCNHAFSYEGSSPVSGNSISIVTGYGIAAGQGGDHQAIPRSQDFLVSQRPDPFLARLQQHPAPALQIRRQLLNGDPLSNGKLIQGNW